MTEFGTLLRDRRKAKGMSLDALAEKVFTSRGQLSKIENGKANANPTVVAACDTALEAGGELVEAFGKHEVDRAGGGLRGLPDPTGHFVGRAEALDVLASVLRGESARMCVVHGLAGVGKTTVAITAARAAEDAFPDGRVFLDLRGHTPRTTPGTGPVEPLEALHTLLSLLGVSRERLPPDVDGRSNLLRDLVRDRRMLLVFDNVATVAQVRPLLPAGGTCRVLITSRGRLPALDEAWSLPLGTLGTDDAVALLRSVAGDRAPAGAQAREIVSLCGNLPLAIRIAAARLVAGSGTRLRDRLADERTRLLVLDDGERGVAAAFAVSHDALTPAERALFGLLAVHPGPVLEIPAVEAMSALPFGEAEALLDRLHDAGLITLDAAGHIGMHDLVRTFALRHALPPDPGVRAAAVVNLVDYALARVTAADEVLEPSRYRPDTGRPTSCAPFADTSSALAWLRVQWPTLERVVDLAAEHGLHRSCWQLAFVLRAFFFRDKLYEPWLATHQRALKSTAALDDLSATGMIRNNLGMAYIDAGRISDAVDAHERALAAFTDAGDERGRTDALSSLAWARLYHGEAAISVRDLTTALEAYRAAGRVRNMAIARRGIALGLTRLGRHDEAVEHAEAALAQAEAELQPVDALMAINCLAWIHFCAGRLDLAVELYTKACGLGELAGSAYERARALTGLGNVAALRGDRVAAKQHWGEADRQETRLLSAVLEEARVRAELGP
ncbi:helix-turn-helix domain-containing protein [Actinokineospora cianjurensis]|uniref:Tetratricopeptide repeat protein n=1 Tax=Actinokineospora cianjurensis TaxID=585224 RepID=A0A421BBN1_9PSEU|nr:helix-turn-helix domain-containing protein [Actinokineospora cianjurensis]RLK61753.1 tetratricopeptide repeat protein [Actinokineospora cianjurensis]